MLRVLALGLAPCGHPSRPEVAFVSLGASRLAAFESRLSLVSNLVGFPLRDGVDSDSDCFSYPTCHLVDGFVAINLAQETLSRVVTLERRRHILEDLEAPAVRLRCVVRAARHTPPTSITNADHLGTAKCAVERAAAVRADEPAR